MTDQRASIVAECKSLDQLVTLYDFLLTLTAFIDKDIIEHRVSTEMVLRRLTPEQKTSVLAFKNVLSSEPLWISLSSEHDEDTTTIIPPLPLSPIQLDDIKETNEHHFVSQQQQQQRNLITYQPIHSSPIVLVPSDLTRLDPNEFLNDTIIDFYLR
jgi:Ulp1 family protease